MGTTKRTPGTRTRTKTGATSGTRAAGQKSGTGARRPAAKRAAPQRAEGMSQSWFELRRSPIQGQGAFALRDIPRGTRIVEYTGERISQEEADRRYDDAQMKRHHTFLFTLDDGTVIDAAVGGNEARFINHSCDPNCEAVIERKRIFIYAKRRIRAGDELAYDYQYEYQDDYTEEDEQFYACRCGSPKCRGTILAPKKKGRGARR